MPERLSPADVLALRDQGFLLLDARSPSEYARGHVPGALSLPVLSDEERDAVGKAHAKGGPDAAVREGLALVGPHLDELTARARDVLARHSVVCVHCWRGGMRSAALAVLLEAQGARVRIMEGGYKAYRAHVRAGLAEPARALVLGGMTGSGKTAVLRALADLGSQVIDLEDLAGHRGSAFGGVGLPPQPSAEAMENALHEAWRRLDRSRPVWLEDEDRRIGSIALCDEFFAHVRDGRFIWLETPRAVRQAHLVDLYTRDDSPALRAGLADAVARLEKRLGSEAARVCRACMLAGRFDEAVGPLLDYYDKLYLRQKEKRGVPAATVTVARHDPAAAARELRRVEEEWG